MSGNVFDVLKERGLIAQCTHENEIRELLGKEKVTFYIGFDPTADCLHVGHFMQVIIMMYMQKFGHTPVVLIGGGTGMVGDPSGRTDMRQVMTVETIEHNCSQFKKLFDRFLDFDEEWEYVGNNGVYMITVSNQKTTEGTINVEQEIQQQNMRTSYTIPYQVVSLIEEKANIVDNRARFQ